MPLAQQEEAIKQAGLEGKVKPDQAYTKEALSYLIKEHQEDAADQLAFANAKGHHLIPRLAGGFAASLTDPLMLASGAIPFVPAAKAAQMLERAGTSLGKYFARAKAGAISGAAGAALLEPLTWQAQNSLQKDYSCYQSLLNIVAGATLGATFHVAGGLIQQARSKARPIAQPSEWQQNITEQLARREPASSREALELEASRLALVRTSEARYLAAKEGMSLEEFQAKVSPTPEGFELIVTPEEWELGRDTFLDSFTGATAPNPEPSLTRAALDQGLATLRLYQSTEPAQALPSLLQVHFQKLAQEKNNPPLTQALATLEEKHNLSLAPMLHGEHGQEILPIPKATLARSLILNQDPELAPLAEALTASLTKDLTLAAQTQNPISVQMTQALDDLLSLPQKTASQEFSRLVNQLEDPGYRELMEGPGIEPARSGEDSSLRLYDKDGNPLDDASTLARLTEEDRLPLEEAQAKLAAEHPELAELMSKEAETELALADLEIERAKTQGDLMRSYAQCLLR